MLPTAPNPYHEIPTELNDRSEIARAVRLLCSPGDVYELRVMDAKQGATRLRTVSGYFTDLTRMERSAASLSGYAPAIYMTINPCTPDVLARSANRTTSHARHTTGDAEILCRRWLPLDFDPVRPAGVSSTDAEHEAAIAMARACREWLRSQGFSEPILADSGNGAHLLYRIDLPNTDGSRAQVEVILKKVADRFNDHAVTVDTSVGNAARIWKLYGTLAAKGHNIPDRPHRISRILECPND